jgi:hypothetical protein
MTDFDKEKLWRLGEEYGLAPDDLIEEFGLEELVPAICTNGGCDYTTEYEPDQSEGWCERCEMRSVSSALVLAGVI